MVQVPQFPALSVVLKDPAAQAAHARSAVDFPSALTDCPG
jgi:hypothetical protein